MANSFALRSIKSSTEPSLGIGNKAMEAAAETWVLPPVFPEELSAYVSASPQSLAILQRLQAEKDAASYHVWFRIGCALANAFGEDGRLYFHRISQQHPGYTYRNTDDQFSRCLRWKGNWIGLGTVLHGGVGI